MKIAVVTSYFPTREQPQRGHSAYQTLRAMCGVDIEVFCPLTIYPSWCEPRNFPYGRTDLTYSPPDMRACYVEYPGLPIVSRPFNGFTAARRLLPHVQRFNPDLILNYSVYPEGYAAVSLGRHLGVPVVLGAIGSDINRIPDPISGWLTRKTLRSAARVVTVSRHLSRQAIRLGAHQDRTRVVWNGCDSSIFRLSDRESARAKLGIDLDAALIVFTGWISPSKGLADLLDAVIQLAPTHRTLRLVCLGSGSYRDELERKAQSAGVEQQVRFPGPSSPSEVARWLAAASVFCLPSHAEGLPNAVIEALACGRPVVATRVGGIPELIDAGSGLLVPPRNSEALAAALGEALARSWDEFAISSRFTRSWSQVARETLDICTEALSTSHGR